MLIEHWPVPLKSEIIIGNLSWLLANGGHDDTLNLAQLALFDYPDRGFFHPFSCLCLLCPSITHTDGAWTALFARKVAKFHRVIV